MKGWLVAETELARPTLRADSCWYWVDCCNPSIWRVSAFEASLRCTLWSWV